MTKRNALLFALLLALGVIGAIAYKNVSRLDFPVSTPTPDLSVPTVVSPGENDTPFPLKVPDGFKIEAFAKDLDGARVIVKDGLGNYLVSQPSQGQVSMIEMASDGTVSHVTPLLRGLDKPHGLAIDPQNKTVLYVAEQNKISRVSLYSEDKLTKIADLPSGGKHVTRTIGFGPDGKLYVSIGSTCDVCRETDPERAAILTWDQKDGLQPFASGLRNTVFFAWDSAGKMWGDDMGRDGLGSDLPPDELNLLQAGKNYGWPNCYGQGIHDTDFDKNVYIRDPCADPVKPVVEFPAHSAALGLASVPKGWPAKYAGGMIVAMHGSMDVKVGAGYKLAYADPSTGKAEDFITGWLDDGKVSGRPADVLAVDDAMYVTDDKAGLVYKITYVGK